MHIIGVPKVKHRELRDISMDVMETMGITGGRLTKATIYMGKWIYITTIEHYENALKYVRKYKVEIDNADQITIQDLGLKNRKKTEVRDLIKEINIPEITQEEVQEWRREFKTDKVWKHKLLKTGAPKYQFGKYQKMEQRVRKYELSQPLSLDIQQEIKSKLSILIQLLSTYIKIMTKDNDIGRCLVIFGEAAQFKSTVVRVLGKYFGGASIWPGSTFIKENDTLKWDSHVKSGNTSLIIEEMVWIAPAKKITMRDTLTKIKELFTGDGLDVRLAKNSECPIIQLEVKYMFITSNSYPGANANSVRSFLDADPSLKRRIVCREQHIDENNIGWLNDNYGELKEKYGEDLDIYIVKTLEGLHCKFDLKLALPDIEDVSEDESETTQEDIQADSDNSQDYHIPDPPEIQKARLEQLLEECNQQDLAKQTEEPGQHFKELNKGWFNFF